jgi:excisionase family DNA binding protein
MYQKKNYLTWDDVPVLISLEQAAILLGVGVDAVRKYCVANELPAIRIGKNWHIDKRKLMEKFGYTR